MVSIRGCDGYEHRQPFLWPCAWEDDKGQGVAGLLALESVEEFTKVVKRFAVLPKIGRIVQLMHWQPNMVQNSSWQPLRKVASRGYNG